MVEDEVSEGFQVALNDNNFKNIGRNHPQRLIFHVKNNGYGRKRIHRAYFS